MPDVFDGSRSRVAVLGGTGWLGRHVCATFAEQGYPVIVIARNHAAHVSGYQFHALDLAAASTETIAELLRSERVDTVINATTSINSTDGWERTDAEHMQIHLTLVERLLGALGTLPWRARVVQLGTIHEYGPVPHGTAIAETQPTCPVNVYGRSKLAGSEAVLNAARSGAVEGVVLRMVNLCGPHPQPDSFPGRLLRLLREASAGRDEKVTVTIADARRDFVDVRDVAEAVFAAAREPVSGQVINIGSGVAVDIGELVRMFAAEAGFTPARMDVRGGPVRSLGGDWTQADIALADRLLSWRPRVELKQSLQDMWLAAR